MSESGEPAPLVKTSDELEGADAEHDASAQEEEEQHHGRLQADEDGSPLSLGRLVDEETGEPDHAE